MKKLIPLLLLLVSMPSLAERQFDIEVIIFKRAVDAEQISESWPDSQPAISLKSAGRFDDANYRHSKGVKMLAYSDYQLTDQIQQLKKHAGFEVLLHTAWRQGEEGRADAPIFHIQAGKDYSTQFNPDGSEITHSSTDTPVNGVVERTVAKPLYELDGKLQIYVQHYLYAETTMDLKSPSEREVVLKDKPLDLHVAPEQQNATVLTGNLQSVSPKVDVESFLKNYRMDQKRRMRSGETHYLDHPLMGVIIQVRRVE